MNEQSNFGFLAQKQFSPPTDNAGSGASERLRENHWSFLNNFYVPARQYLFYYVRTTLTYKVSVCDNIYSHLHWIQSFDFIVATQQHFKILQLQDSRHFRIQLDIMHFFRCSKSWVISFFKSELFGEKMLRRSEDWFVWFAAIWLNSGTKSAALKKSIPFCFFLKAQENVTFLTSYYAF